MGNRHRRDNSVCAHSLRYQHNGANMNGQDPCLFYFLGQRCTATRAGPSRGSDNDRVDAFIQEIVCDFLCEILCIGNGGPVSHGCIVIRIQLLNNPRLLQFFDDIQRQYPVGVCIGGCGVITAVYRFIPLRAELVEIADIIFFEFVGIFLHAMSNSPDRLFQSRSR